MKRVKKLGVWMDHSIAYLMEFTNNPFEIKTIESQLRRDKKNFYLSESTQLSINKDLATLYSYYNKIGEAIKGYQQIVLFGPTTAKVELFDMLSEDDRFLKIRFEIKDTDKMNAKQQNEFITKYFANI
jgi:hypothetical protein